MKVTCPHCNKESTMVFSLQPSGFNPVLKPNLSPPPSEIVPPNGGRVFWGRKYYGVDYRKVPSDYWDYIQRTPTDNREIHAAMKRWGVLKGENETAQLSLDVKPADHPNDNPPIEKDDDVPF